MRQDPFPPATDPRQYVPREASERALAELEAALDAGAARVLFEGPPGIGKTLLVRVLAERCRARFRPALASYPALPLDELCAWVLRELRAPAGDDPEASLVALASGDRTRPLLLIVDDAQSLPRETATGLGSLVERAAGGLRLLLVATDGEHPSPWQESPGCERRLRFDAPMLEAETAAYLAARLEAGRVPAATRARFDSAAIAALHTEAEGIPGRLHEGAIALLRGVAPASPPEALPPETRQAPELPAPEPSLERRGRSRLIAAAAALLGVGLWLLLRAGDGPEPAPEAPPGPPEPPRAPAAALAPPTPTAPLSDPEPAPALAQAPVAPPTPSPLTLQVNATPWARIELDGSPIGVTPLAGIEVEPGHHRVSARMPDGRLLERDVMLSPEHRHLVFE